MEFIAALAFAFLFLAITSGLFKANGPMPEEPDDSPT